MLISDWSSDVCSSDLAAVQPPRLSHPEPEPPRAAVSTFVTPLLPKPRDIRMTARGRVMRQAPVAVTRFAPSPTGRLHLGHALSAVLSHVLARAAGGRSEEHTSELQSLMRNSYAVFCLTTQNNHHTTD